MADFKPSSVRLDAIPFVNAFGRAEYEAAAAVLVRACVVHGDTWAAHGPAALSQVLRDDVEAGRRPFVDLAHNPFWRPSITGLVDAGFAEYSDDSDLSPVRFTPTGLQRLERFSREE